MKLELCLAGLSTNRKQKNQVSVANQERYSIEEQLGADWV